MGLEEQIAESLRTLDDTTLDRVARSYARARFPDRFHWIDGLGINDEGQPIGGRPDAFVYSPDLTLDRIEVTRHASKSQIRDRALTKGHFPKILAAIRESEIGGGLVYVAGHPKIQFTPSEIGEMTNAAVGAGLERSRVHIVGADALAEALSRPELAGVRIRLLGVGAPKAFELMRRELSPDQRRLSGPDIPNPFIPTSDDLDAGAIHFPATGLSVEEQLRRQRVCLIRGLGASGKSVLAWLIGLRWGQAGNPCYLVNLQNITGDAYNAARDCIDDLRILAAPNALFIVDNCHLDNEAAQKIYLAWKDLNATGPALLLLARETRSRSGSRLDELDLEPVILRARHAEVAGVFNRLATRHVREQDSVGSAPRPPADVVDSWVNIFGGPPAAPETTTDLIAFSAAVQRRIKHLLREDWKLSEEHASEEVRRHYIRPLTIPERRNLYRLSVFQKIEMDLPGQLLPYPVEGLSTCVEKVGLVFAYERGFSKTYRHYQLAHPALGHLILKASEESIDEIDIYTKVAAADGYSALPLLVRLEAAGHESAALAVRRVLLDSPQLFSKMSIVYWKWLLDEVEKVTDKKTFSEFVTKLADSSFSRDVVAQAAAGSLSHLCALVRYLEASGSSSLSSFSRWLATSLIDKANVTSLINSALTTHIGGLTALLSYLGQSIQEEYKGLYSAILSELSSQHHLSNLVTIIINSPLNEISHWLSYLEHSEVPLLRNLHKKLAAELAGEKGASIVTRAVAPTYLSNLAPFLRYFERSAVVVLRTLNRKWAGELSDEIQLAFLARLASRSPPGDVAGFLRYLTHSELEEVRGIVSPFISQLQEPVVLSKFAESIAMNAPDQFDGLLNLLLKRADLDPFASALVTELPASDGLASILAARANSMMMEADVSLQVGLTAHSIDCLQRIRAIFGASTARVVQEIVAKSQIMEAAAISASESGARKTRGQPPTKG